MGADDLKPDNSNLDEEKAYDKEAMKKEIADILGDDLEAYTLTMEDEETGEEFTFYMLDDFAFENDIYSVLINIDAEPEAVFAKVVTLEDGTMNFTTVSDDEFTRVSEYYQALAEEDAAEDEIFYDENDSHDI